MVAIAVFVAGWIGFSMLHQQRIPFAGQIVGLLFDFLFLTLGTMLFFSTGIILYGSLFSSGETAFLLSTPARADRIFAYKFQTAVGFSSWAFLLLGLPVLFAYGIVYAVSWPFFLVLPVFLIGYVLLPGSVGSLFCIVIVSLVPQRRKQALVVLGLVVVALAGWWGYEVFHSAGTALGGDRDALQGLFGQLKFASHPLVPSHWMSWGLQASARGDLSAALMPLALVWTNGLMAYLMAAFAAKQLYRSGYNRIATGAELRKRYRESRLDQLQMHLLFFLDRPTRLLIIKDFRTFRRDPAQWAQILLFIGLMMLYFLPTRQFYTEDLGRRGQQGVSLMNLFATSMLLCAYMGRFIYPMISLEGRKFWILGLLPLPRNRLLWGKFGFAAVGAMVFAQSLVILSDFLLRLDPIGIAIHVLTVAMLSLGLSGLSVGLGAIMPNFRETDPSKIAVGYGGTMNLVASLMYLLVTISLMAAPYHAVQLSISERDSWTLRDKAIVVMGLLVGVVVASCAIVIPLRAGIRNLRRMEF